MTSHRVQIETRIAEAIRIVVQAIAVTDTSLAEAAGHEADRDLALNSSFIYRDKRAVKTHQSSRRLVTKLNGSGKRLKADEICIVDDLSLKAHYRILSSGDISEKVLISDAVAQELASIGDLIFVLIGTVKGLRPTVTRVDGGPIVELRLTPSATGQIEKVEAGVYAVQKIVPIEELLAQINRDFEAQGGLANTERRKIAEAYDELLDGAITDVVIPTRTTVKPDETILGQIVTSLKGQTREYLAALKILQTGANNRQALNEVLRIAYNFTTDVLPLIFLFVSLCDLKPIVFWCTVDKQWALYRAFAALPWSAMGRKEKLEEYESIVAQARNHAFHHVLPFEATVEIDLSDFDVRAEKMRLFSSFGQKQERGIRLRDQELADVLANFSRAKERPVSRVFWEKNLDVMQAACELAQGILDALILIHAARATRIHGR